MAASGSEVKHGFYNKNIRPFTNASRRRKSKDKSWMDTPDAPF